MWLCSLCGLSYNHRQSLNRHMSTNHKEFVSNAASSSFKCSVCNTSVPKRKEILIHFFEEHGINVEESSQSFATLQQFKKWKAIYEEQHTLKYVLMFGTDNRRCGTVHYICNRSGSFRSRGNGIRHLKNQGKNKIDGFCPSRMKLHIQENGCCTLSFIPTHVGHDKNVNHLDTSKNGENSLETKVVSDVPFCSVLDNVKNSQHSEEQLEEVNLISKDLDSISRNLFFCSGTVKHIHDVANVDAGIITVRNNCNTESQNVIPEVIPQYLACPIIGAEPDCKGYSLLEEKEPVIRNMQEDTISDLEVHKIKLLEKFKEIVECVESHEEANIIEKVLQKVPSAISAICNGIKREPHQEICVSRNRDMQWQRAAKKLKRITSEKDQAHVILNILTSVNS